MLDFVYVCNDYGIHVVLIDYISSYFGLVKIIDAICGDINHVWVGQIMSSFIVHSITANDKITYMTTGMFYYQGSISPMYNYVFVTLYNGCLEMEISVLFLEQDLQWTFIMITNDDHY